MRLAIPRIDSIGLPPVLNILKRPAAAVSSSDRGGSGDVTLLRLIAELADGERRRGLDHTLIWVVRPSEQFHRLPPTNPDRALPDSFF
ncbi:hypothetical protein JQ615_31155 [Bradyrhizobium jicamae]|uniref:Uncharacterized protein n=1 Tax=Bradyrhizobium jicamae TaxID=280332 RepID=A0ABS5FSP7_9BRAD|nr:hypothetical protein [Bradyrhizobium jicamae]MBR0799836.1 hypothetical protein [Bradyrhizobium jicamae]